MQQEQVQKIRAAVRELRTLAAQSSTLLLDAQTASSSSRGAAAAASVQGQQRNQQLQAKINAVHSKMISSLVIGAASSKTGGGTVNVSLVSALIEASDGAVWTVLRAETTAASSASSSSNATSDNTNLSLSALFVDLLLHPSPEIVSAAAACLDTAVCSQVSGEAVSSAAAAAATDPYTTLLSLLHQRGAFRALVSQISSSATDSSSSNKRSLSSIARAVSSVLTSLPVDDGFVWSVLGEVAQLVESRTKISSVPTTTTTTAVSSPPLSAEQQYIQQRVSIFCDKSSSSGEEEDDDDDLSPVLSTALELAFSVVENFPVSSMLLALPDDQQQKRRVVDILQRLLRGLFSIIDAAFDLFQIGDAERKKLQPDVQTTELEALASVPVITADKNVNIFITPLDMTSFEGILADACSVLRLLVADAASVPLFADTFFFDDEQQQNQPLVVSVLRNAVQALRTFVRRPGALPAWLQHTVGPSSAVGGAGCTEVRDAALGTLDSVLRTASLSANNNNNNNNNTTLLYVAETVLKAGLLGVLAPLANSFAFDASSSSASSRRRQREDDHDGGDGDGNLEKATRLLQLTRVLMLLKRCGDSLSSQGGGGDTSEETRKRCLLVQTRLSEKIGGGGESNSSGVLGVCKLLLTQHQASLSNAKKSTLIAGMLSDDDNEGNSDDDEAGEKLDVLKQIEDIVSKL